MVCWITRVKRLGISIPLDVDIEKELMKELDVRSHNELERTLNFIHDETLESIIMSIINNRKKAPIKRKEPIADIYR